DELLRYPYAVPYNLTTFFNLFCATIDHYTLPCNAYIPTVVKSTPNNNNNNDNNNKQQHHKRPELCTP
ncbi:hypothetical protein CHUAL_001382, partial [Chamberlinius hualienensis]